MKAWFEPSMTKGFELLYQYRGNKEEECYEK